MADVNNLKAEFGSAYVRAVAHTAGYFVQEANRMMDADGVDLTIFARGSRGQMRSPRLDVQLKTTQHGLEDEAVTLDLPVKNYDELRAAGYQTPRILVVVVVPPTPRDWLVATEEQLALKRCGYWTSLLGRPDSTNETAVRVRLPRTARFHVEQLQALMARVCAGDL